MSEIKMFPSIEEVQGLSTNDLQDILLELSGRSKLTLKEVNLYYAADEELERRSRNERRKEVDL